MARTSRVAVVGYGSAGQAVALLLAADGHRVEVFEQTAAPGPVGAGFLLQPVGQRVLWELGLLPAVLQHAAIVTRLHGETAAGRPVMDIRYGELDRRLFGLGLQRSALFSIMDAAWTTERVLHCGQRIVQVDCERGAVTDAGGRRFDGYDLVVVADGAGSMLRSQVAVASLDRPYPWGAQWCLLAADGWQWPRQLRQRYVGARRMAGMLPVGTRPGDPTPRLSFFWSVPVTALAAAADAAAPADADADAAAWHAAVAAVWPEAARRLAGTAAPQGLAQARYRDTVHAGWHRGRALLIGDAAHAMSPQLGQGVNMALLDALALRDALRGTPSIAAALAQYQQARRAHVAIYHFWSRWLTPLFQSEQDRWAALRDRLFHPLSRLPVARGQMLRVLSGTRRGWLGVMRLPQPFLAALPDVDHGA